MNCREALELMHGYVDGELDLAQGLEIEQHLGGCPACKVQYDALRELSANVRANAVYYAASPAARARLGRALGRSTLAVSHAIAWTWWRGAAALALALLVGLGLGLVLRQPAGADRLADEVVESHVRSLMANHLTDVASSDEHTVKPWIAGKLDFSPPVADFAAEGYVLAGGRLDYLGGHAAMALVYRHHGHVINAFVWPDASAAALRPRFSSRRGYHLGHFVRGGMEYWIVSDLNAAELKSFVGLLQRG